MYPGLTLFTVIPYRAHSAARLLFSCSSAPLLVLYPACGCGKFTLCAEMLAVNTIRPPRFCFTNSRAAACAQMKAPVVLMSRVLRNCEA
ncbi:hypothetical protein CNYM01_14373, partial [Colletotrichum nymphaeae SA-01]